MLDVDAVKYLISSYSPNYKITNAYHKATAVGGVACPGQTVGNNPLITVLITETLTGQQGLLLTDLFVREFENLGSAFLAFALRTNGYYLQDYNSISGTIINFQAPFSIGAVFSPGALVELVCLNYSGTAGFAAATTVTTLGYFAGFRYLSSASQINRTPPPAKAIQAMEDALELNRLRSFER